MFNKIFNDDVTLTDQNLFNVHYQQDVNNDDNIQVGIASSASLKFETDIARETIELLEDEFTYQASFTDSTNLIDIGKFKITDIVKKSGDHYLVTAYDTLYAFNKNVDEWVDDIQEHHLPITMILLFKSLCNECGAECEVSPNFINGSFELKYPQFKTINCTGRLILGYIAGVAGGFAYADADGIIKISNYHNNNSFTITDADLISCDIKDYKTPIIDKVWVAQEEDDMGVSSGTGDQVVRIEYNPLLLASEASEILTQVDNIYNLLHGNDYSYYPATIETFGTESLSYMAGSRMVINGKSSIIMSREIMQSGVIYSSTGDASRPVSNDSTIPLIQALRGKAHKLEVSISGIEDIVTDRATGNAKVLTWDANSGLVVCNDVTGNVVKITGDNIAANAISAGKIQTGVIEFSNFSTKCLEQLNSTSDIPVWAKGTYIDFSSVNAPMIRGGDIVLAGGTFDIKDIDGLRSFGTVGLGRKFGKDLEWHNGTILSNTDDRFIFIADDGVLIQFEDYGIRIDSSGIYRIDHNTETSIGPAVFA